MLLGFMSCFVRLLLGNFFCFVRRFSSTWGVRIFPSKLVFMSEIFVNYNDIESELERLSGLVSLARAVGDVLQVRLLLILIEEIENDVYNSVHRKS